MGSQVQGLSKWIVDTMACLSITALYVWSFQVGTITYMTLAISSTGAYQLLTCSLSNAAHAIVVVVEALGLFKYFVTYKLNS